PTTGVDAVSRKEFWEMLKRLKEQGITILVSTPYMDEAGLCDRVALIQSGRIMQIDTPAGIVQQFGKKLLAVKSSNMLELLKVLNDQDVVENAYPFGEYHHVVLKDDGADVLRNELNRNGIVVEMKETEANIEDCFIRLMRDN
ncbi:MAG TPA: ABC transporter ATP-binding protein, partial [Chitinophagaceae bacterium]|nr:ABC transporter ATP-binding protein [Chitinophagaceae bacterium]